MLNGETTERRSRAVERAKERFGLDLTNRDLRTMVKLIKAGRSILLGREREAERHGLCFKGKSICAIYVPETELIATVYPEFSHRQVPDKYRAKVKKQRTPGRDRTRREKDKLRAIMQGEAE